jgi:hypothetical protein
MTIATYRAEIERVSHTYRLIVWATDPDSGVTSIEEVVEVGLDYYDLLRRIAHSPRRELSGQCRWPGYVFPTRQRLERVVADRFGADRPTQAIFLDDGTHRLIVTPGPDARTGTIQVRDLSTDLVEVLV